ncbi:MAG: D-2-hydroxyacid dehydrogenase [Azonexus sp.]
MIGKVVVSYPSDVTHLANLQACAPGWQIVPVSSEQQARREFVDADVVLGNPHFIQALPSARHLKWMQSNSVGMDLLLSSERVRAGDFLISNARGVYDAELADHTLAMILSLLRGITASERNRLAGVWHRRALVSIEGTHTLVFGYGGVGREVCRRLRLMGGQVTAVRRQPDVEVASEVPVIGLNEGLARLPEADIVVLALPLTAETENLFDRKNIAALPAGCFLINVSRGGLIDESALESALDRLGGVGLDCLREEPPPSGHWAWRHPGVLLTPHVGRAPESSTGRRFYSLFEHNLGRWASGQLPINLIDRTLGY